MQKKLIALAIASALTMPALAYAGATVYGVVDLSIDMINDGLANSGRSNNLVNNSSRIGVKGSEDLNDGLSAVWQMEGSVAMDANGAPPTSAVATLFNRDTYLGLSSTSMGSVLLGLHQTPYMMSTRKLDVFADSDAADNRGLMGATHDVRRGNSINYMSPNMGGLSVAVASVFGAEGASSTDTKGTAFSLAGMYSMDPLYATLAYDSVKFGSVGDLGGPGSVDDKSTAFKLGVGYMMDVITVNAVLERPTYKTAAGSETTSTNLYLGGKFGLGSTDAIKAAYTKKGETTVAGVKQANDVSQIAIGYDHDMSKTTSVYALYTKITDNGPAGTATTAADPSTFSIGMKHSF